MRRYLTGLLLPWALLFASAVSAENGPEELPDRAQETRAVALQRELRCVVCQGESLDESNALLAADLRRLIRAKIAQGWTDPQIEKYLVARYGDFILMKPPLEPSTYVLWFGPLVVFSIGGVAAATVISRARRQARAPG